MRHTFFFMLLLSFGACAQSTSTVLEPMAFDSMLSSDSSLSLLDVRTADEFASGHIEKAVNIDFYADDFTKQAAGLPKDKKVLIYCLSGGRSAEAAKKLSVLGYEVFELRGGIAAWRAANLPVEGGIAQIKQVDKTREAFFSELDSNILYLIDFNAKWCLPCRQLVPIVEKLDSLYGDELTLVKVDFDSHRQLASDLQVEGLPYVLLVKRGQVLWSYFGLPSEAELKEAIDARR